MLTLNPNRAVHDTLESSREKFIGKPLKNLYNKHAFSQKSFVLFCENPDGSNRRWLGDDLNLSLLIMRNAKYAGYPVVKICRYYEQIHVIINPPEEEKEK